MAKKECIKWVLPVDGNKNLLGRHMLWDYSTTTYSIRVYSRESRYGGLYTWLFTQKVHLYVCINQKYMDTVMSWGQRIATAAILLLYFVRCVFYFGFTSGVTARCYPFFAVLSTLLPHWITLLAKILGLMNLVFPTEFSSLGSASKNLLLWEHLHCFLSTFWKVYRSGK